VDATLAIYDGSSNTENLQHWKESPLQGELRLNFSFYAQTKLMSTLLKLYLNQ